MEEYVTKHGRLPVPESSSEDSEPDTPKTPPSFGEIFNGLSYSEPGEEFPDGVDWSLVRSALTKPKPNQNRAAGKTTGGKAMKMRELMDRRKGQRFHCPGWI